MVSQTNSTGGEPRRHVLLAEDHGEISSLVKIFLEDEGYEVKVVTDGEQALAAIDDRNPDLLLLDLWLPLMNGEEVATALDQGEAARPPIVLLSASADLAAHARRIGAAGYVRKPFDLDELLAKIQDALRVIAEP